MKASILDLRYRMKEVLEALDRRETVQIYHRRKLRGTIQPNETDKPGLDATKHAFFGYGRTKPTTGKKLPSVESVIASLRDARATR